MSRIQASDPALQPTRAAGARPQATRVGEAGAGALPAPPVPGLSHLD